MMNKIVTGTFAVVIVSVMLLTNMRGVDGIKCANCQVIGCKDNVQECAGSCQTIYAKVGGAETISKGCSPTGICVATNSETPNGFVNLCCSDLCNHGGKMGAGLVTIGTMLTIVLALFFRS